MDFHHAPKVTVLQERLQAFGGAGVTTDVGSSSMSGYACTLRIIDEPGDVRRHRIGRLDFAKYPEFAEYRPARADG